MLFGLRAKKFLRRSLPIKPFDILARPAKLPQEEREESWEKSHLSNFDSGLILSNSWSQKNIIVKMGLCWKNSRKSEAVVPMSWRPGSTSVSWVKSFYGRGLFASGLQSPGLQRKEERWTVCCTSVKAWSQNEFKWMDSVSQMLKLKMSTGLLLLSSCFLHSTTRKLKNAQKHLLGV